MIVDENLVNTIKEKGGIEACIWGKVHSEGPPIHSLQNSEVVGVIWKHTIQEHIIAQIMGVW